MWDGVRMFAICLLATVVPQQACADADYSLSIDGQAVDLTLGEDTKATLKDGKTVTLRLSLKPVQSYKAKGIRFQYPSGMSVSAREIETGISQHMIATATGTVLIMQVYDDLDATALVTLMTGKMTDDDVATGATRDTKPHTRRLKDGSELTGTRSVLSASQDNTVVEVLAKRQGKGGAMLITRHDRQSSPEDKTLIDTFWETLQLD